MPIIPDLIVVNDKRITPGVLAGRTYNPGNKILEFTGDVSRGEDLAAPYVGVGFMQVGPDLFLNVSRSCPAAFMKHSCEPNAGVVFKSDGRIELVTINHIPPMGEIVWDFSTTISSIEKAFDCTCGKASCRKVIGCYPNLPEPVRRRYEYLGIVAPYLAPMTVIR